MASCIIDIARFAVLDIFANVFAKFLDEIAIIDTAKGSGKPRVCDVVMFHLENVSNH